MEVEYSVTTPPVPPFVKSDIPVLTDVKTILANRSTLANSMQFEFNKELTTVKNLEDKYLITTNPNIGVCLADPTKCYTIFWQNDEISDFINHLKVQSVKHFDWRNEGPGSNSTFGLSGELSIARLISYALEMTIAMCKISELDKYFIQRNTADDTADATTIFKYFKDTEKTKIFNDTFKKDIPSREDFDKDPAKDLVMKMLIIIQQLKISFDLVYATDKITEQKYLSDAYKFLTKIILTKSSLDSCQAETISHLVNVDTNNFCLFNTYDFSAVVNTPYCPVMSAVKYPGVQGEFIFIIDNSAIFALVLILVYDFVDTTPEYNSIKAILEEKGITTLDNFYNNPNILEEEDLNELSLYDLLEKYGNKLNNISIPISKSNS